MIINLVTKAISESPWWHLGDSWRKKSCALLLELTWPTQEPLLHSNKEMSLSVDWEKGQRQRSRFQWQKGTLLLRVSSLPPCSLVLWLVCSVSLLTLLEFVVWKTCLFIWAYLICCILHSLPGVPWLCLRHRNLRIWGEAAQDRKQRNERAESSQVGVWNLLGRW